MKEVSYFTSNVIKITLKADLGECWIWKLALDSSGRPLYTDRSQKPSTRNAYRDLWKLVKNPELVSETNLNHKCDEPRCINPDHLYEGTDAENRRDAVERKRINPRKIKGKEEKIVRLFKEGIEQQEIAKQIGVSPMTIQRYLNGQTNQNSHNYVKEAQELRDSTIRQLHSEGKGIRQIMRELKVPQSVVYRVIPKK